MNRINDNSARASHDACYLDRDSTTGNRDRRLPLLESC